MAWHRESRRHSLASRGIKSAQRIPPTMKKPSTSEITRNDLILFRDDKLGDDGKYEQIQDELQERFYPSLDELKSCLYDKEENRTTNCDIDDVKQAVKDKVGTSLKAYMDVATYSFGKDGMEDNLLVILHRYWGDIHLKDAIDDFDTYWKNYSN